MNLVTDLQSLEKEKLKTLTNRLKIFKSHIASLEKADLSLIKIKTDVYNILNELNSYIKTYQNEMIFDKNELGQELTQVKGRIRSMGRVREFTAQRIDITT